ncbi:MAG: T9SS type A sorting domain-containing protein [Bacteroidetes bacterium]|nr:T9SS type A sorting domain-containing protein [Bacteroidota bacterium]
MKKIITIVSFIYLILVVTLTAQISDSNDWNWQYPKPQGNTLRDVLTIDENTVIAVGDLGTVIKTTDGGENWKVLHHTGGISDDLYGVHFVDSLNGWAVGGEHIISTVDGGENWSVLHEDLSSSLRCVYFFNPDTGWVFGKGIIMKTLDRGKSWSKNIIYDGDEKPIIREVQFLDAQIGYIVGSSFYGNTIYKTMDGGSRWYQLNNIKPRIYGLTDLSFINADTGWVVSNFGEIIKTEDGGESWLYQEAEGVNVLLHSVFFSDADTGWTSGVIIEDENAHYNGIILKTTNGGNTWEGIKTEGKNETLYSIDISEEAGWAVGADGVIYRTTDGENWAAQREERYRFNSLYFVDENTGWAVGEKGIILHTEDGGSNWYKQNQNDSLVLNSVFAIDKQNIFATGPLVTGLPPDPLREINAVIIKSVDGGISWKRYDLDTLSWLSSIFFVNDSIGWITGNRGTLFKTTNQGNTWIRINLDINYTNAYFKKIQFINEDTGWIISSAVILKTTDGGKNWKSQLIPTTSLNSFDYVNSQTGWIVGQNIVQENIFKSIDGGENWQACTNIPISNYRSVEFINENIGYAAGGFSIEGHVQSTIIKTNDGGETWFEQQSPSASTLSYIFFINETTGWALSEGIVKTSTGGGVVSIENEEKHGNTLPENIELFQNYPNPFNPSTIINYKLSKSGYVTLQVYDILGREIIMLINSEQQPGLYRIEFDAGKYKLSSGVYLYMLRVGGHSLTKKMILLR